MTFETQDNRIARMTQEVIELQQQFDTCDKADKFRVGVTLNMRQNSLEYVRELPTAVYAMADLDTRVLARPQDAGIDWQHQLA